MGGTWRREIFSWVAHNTRSGWNLGANAIWSNVEEAHLVTEEELQVKKYTLSCTTVPTCPQTPDGFKVTAI